MHASGLKEDSKMCGSGASTVGVAQPLLIQRHGAMSAMQALTAAAAAAASVVPARQSSVSAALVPEAFVTSNNAFEVLATNWDVYAEESPPPAPEFIDHHRPPPRAGRRSGLPPPGLSTDQSLYPTGTRSSVVFLKLPTRGDT